MDIPGLVIEGNRANTQPRRGSIGLGAAFRISKLFGRFKRRNSPAKLPVLPENLITDIGIN